MATGARMNEIAGLRMGEVSLGSNIPHIKLRFNSVRRLKNEPSIRDVPLVGEALDLLRDFVATRADAKPDEPLFVRYGRDGGRDAISQVLNKIVDSSVSDDPKLIPNSTRHTMADRLDAVRCPESIKAAILGWSSGQSIRMADNYGTGDPFWSIRKELERAVAVEDWGQFND